jgi:subtilisin family serine protease
MSYDDDILEVPWDSDRWDLAILERPNISFLGGPGRWVLFRPARVIVTEQALEDKRVREIVAAAGADRCDEPDAEVAKALGLALLLAPEDRQVELVRELNRVIHCSASLDNVLLPGPQRIHGDDAPRPAENPGDLSGAGEAGAGVTVLVLDTGNVPASAATLGVQMATTDAEVPDEDLDGLRDPASGHGTHVAGIVARWAPGATIVSRRVLKSPVGDASDLEVASALLNHDGAHVINCSFGAGTLDDQAPLVIQNAIAALPASTVVVGAAGNSGLARPDWPAAFERVVAVGAVGKAAGGGAWLQTDFSNHGSWVDCCAPGVGIVSTFLDRQQEGFHGFASWTGTSMAAPAVAGTIAAMATQSTAGTLAARLANAVTTIRGLPRIGAIGALVDPPTLV